MQAFFEDLSEMLQLKVKLNPRAGGDSNPERVVADPFLQLDMHEELGMVQLIAPTEELPSNCCCGNCGSDVVFTLFIHLV